mmetsp:Transcript_24234/g.63984  ORF Transcript_24234/g.63984 Transcript_24234/m.63984 type:complete len:343 (-) Transcript_24234:494-1522(-)
MFVWTLGLRPLRWRPSAWCARPAWRTWASGSGTGRARGRSPRSEADAPSSAARRPRPGWLGTSTWPASCPTSTLTCARLTSGTARTQKMPSRSCTRASMPSMGRMGSAFAFASRRTWPRPTRAQSPAGACTRTASRCSCAASSWAARRCAVKTARGSPLLHWRTTTPSCTRRLAAPANTFPLAPASSTRSTCWSTSVASSGTWRRAPSTPSIGRTPLATLSASSDVPLPTFRARSGASWCPATGRAGTTRVSSETCTRRCASSPSSSACWTAPGRTSTRGTARAPTACASPGGTRAATCPRACGSSRSCAWRTRRCGPATPPRSPRSPRAEASAGAWSATRR